MRECTPALFNQVVDSEQTARVCAEIEDALERVKRGEMSREDFETYKAEQKKRLAIFTPHAMFPKGRRVNEDAVPSGLSMYDVDHIKPTPSPLTREGSIYQRLVEHTLAKRAITDEEMIAELKRKESSREDGHRISETSLAKSIQDYEHQFTDFG